MNYELALYREFKRRGIDPAKVTKAQMDSVALAVRTLPEKTRAIASNIASHLNVSFSGRVVTLEQLVTRQTKCEKCPSHKITDETKFCAFCGCSGADLEVKQRDADQRCPKPEPEWIEEQLELS